VRVLAVFDDLLLGSNVLGMLRAAGHEAELAPPATAHPQGHDVIIVDLAATDGAALVDQGAKLIGVYSHVDVETKQRAEAAGFDLVVPRSRMAREGPQLVARFGGD
jgi:hypothetical protein